jgi:ATP-dependent protease HslVU (ClpYQ) peptidase subunit
MSVIAFKVTEDKIQVAADGRALFDDRIANEHFKKIIQISDKLIIGATGLAGTIGIYEKFVRANENVFSTLENSTDAVPLFKRFKDYLIDNFGYSEETLKDLGGFLVVNKKFHVVFYYDDGLTPYAVYDTECDQIAFGSTGIYTTALIDCGVPLEEAIKRSAKKYTSINANVTLLEIDRR